MKIFGFNNTHDASICLMENGYPTWHMEKERYSRIKHDDGDMIAFANEIVPDWHKDIDAITTIYPTKKISKYPESFQFLKSLNKPIILIDHHVAHAANAFYSSNFDDTIILTMDGGGSIDDQQDTATTISVGRGNKLTRIQTIPINQVNIGGLWTRVVRYVFDMSNGKPHGDSSGTVMGAASFGNPDKYAEDFRVMLTRDLLPASQKPNGQIDPFVKFQDPPHPYLERFTKLARTSQQEFFDLAAGLQKATEELIYELIKYSLDMTKNASENLCVSGGVALNTVAMGKVRTWFPQIKNIYIGPCAGDMSLSLGSAQYYYHNTLGQERVKWEPHFPAYLGKQYTDNDITQSLIQFESKIDCKKVDINQVVELLVEQNVICVFNGRSESGARALGNRSIVASPCELSIKDKINKKVKNRENYRPFAPSILEEKVSEWFDGDVSSPYMSFVLPFREEKKEFVKAVCHSDGTGRLQTVNKDANPFWYELIEKFEQRTGIPILLNTSFNKREPVVNSPIDALRCFLNTEIDYLYFAELGVLVSRRI